MLGRYERGAGGEAVVAYGDGTMRVVKPGAYVRCAVTGAEIPLDALRYWSAVRQEAYATPEAALEQLKRTRRS